MEWKPEQDNVSHEHEALSFSGRFGPGLPRINDGALLFLLHMISKMQTPPEHYTLGPIKGVKEGEGSRIAIVFNGSPLFTGDAGSGESNIRRYIIENDMLEAVIGLPDQMFYNTGIYTYIWIVTNRNDQRIADFTEGTYFTNLAISKKRKNRDAMKKEEAEGKVQQQAILDVLESLKAALANEGLIKNRDAFEQQLKQAFSDNEIFNASYKWDTSLKKALLSPNALAERDQRADICTDNKGHPEPDPELRDTENVPLPLGLELPLPLAYENKKQNKGKVDKTALLELVREPCEAYLKEEVLPYRADAWIDHSKTRVGYEIPFNRHFYQYEPPRDLADIEADLKGLEQEIMDMLSEVV